MGTSGAAWLMGCVCGRKSQRVVRRGLACVDEESPAAPLPTAGLGGMFGVSCLDIVFVRLCASQSCIV